MVSDLWLLLAILCHNVDVAGREMMGLCKSDSDFVF